MYYLAEIIIGVIYGYQILINRVNRYGKIPLYHLVSLCALVLVKFVFVNNDFLLFILTGEIVGLVILYTLFGGQPARIAVYALCFAGLDLIAIPAGIYTGKSFFVGCAAGVILTLLLLYALMTRYFQSKKPGINGTYKLFLGFICFISILFVRYPLLSYFSWYYDMTGDSAGSDVTAIIAIIAQMVLSLAVVGIFLVDLAREEIDKIKIAGEGVTSESGQYNLLNKFKDLSIENDDISVTLTNIIDIAVSLTGADGGLVYTIDGNSLTYAAANGIINPPYIINNRIMDNYDTYMKTIKDKKISIVENPLFQLLLARGELAIPLDAGAVRKEALGKLGYYSKEVGAALCCVITNQGAPWGVLYLERKGRDFNQLEINVFKALRTTAGSIIGNTSALALKKKQERLEHEMEIAEKIQVSITPTETGITGYQVTAKMFPSEMVGGDYYDIINRGDTSWVCIGDVTGHGVTAGLIAMMTETAIFSIVEAAPDCTVYDLAVRVNEIMYHNLRERMLVDHHVTIGYFKLTVDGAVEFVNAHESVLVYRAATGTVERLLPDSLWCGIVPDTRGVTHMHSLQLAAEDILFVYTDGVIEHRNRMNELFGIERLITIIEKHGRENVETLQDILMKQLGEFSELRSDDISFVIVKKES